MNGQLENLKLGFVNVDVEQRMCDPSSDTHSDTTLSVFFNISAVLS